jgi:hypothetical protein
MKVPTCMLLAAAMTTLALAGCESERNGRLPASGEPMTQTPTPDEMFEYQSKPVGDPGAETYRDEARTGANVEVRVDPPPANNR